MGSCEAINRKIAPTEINALFDAKEIIHAVKMQTTVCIRPISKPTRIYPSIKWCAFIGEEYKRFKKKVCLSLETIKARVSIIKE